MRGQKSAKCYFLWMVWQWHLGAGSEWDNDFRDFRTVAYPELVNGSDVFEADTEDSGHFGQLLVDPIRSQLVAGGRDVLVRLDLEGLRKLETAAWPAKDDSLEACILKGQKEEDCRNYIKILALQGDRLFACGTHAFGPTCSWRKAQEIRRVLEWVDGRGKCPYSPGDNTAALMTPDGELYIGSATDFSSTDHAIYRMGGDRFGDVLRTSQLNPLWLARPDFVGAFDVGPFVYFFFRESAADRLPCGGAVHARVARVCKNDRGEPRGTWATFLKARLRCALPGEPPFDFDHIRSVFYLEAEATFYATFSTAEGAIPGSAVCGFALADVEGAFAGPFKRQARPDATWGPVEADHAQFLCHNVTRETPSPTSREFQLVDRPVLPSAQKPIYHEQISRFTHIVVDVVETKPHVDNKAKVLFVADQTGLIKKISYDGERGEACVVEILHPFPKKGSKILSLKILPSTFSIYLGTENSVLRVPTQRCHRFATEEACINAMDPYCGWNEQRAKCTTAPSRTTKVTFWKQNFSSCPILSTNVTGSWSQWSAWKECLWNDPEKRVSSLGDSCVCRKRYCDSPRPLSGGRYCEGMDIEVTNCTQHGQWTAWSDWSDCSNTCDIGLRQRRRTCGNPAPAFGGKVCIGEDITSQTCEHLPSCSRQQHHQQLDTNFKFSSWSEWSDCSSECGKGFRSRSRSCSNVQNMCDDARTLDFSECENLRCTDPIKVFDYTPWVRLSYNDTDSWMERRFRFEYSVPASSSDTIKAIPGLVLSEDRTCRGGSSNCSILTVNSLKDSNGDDWTEWSRCSRECGGGYQMRLNTCDLDDPRCFSTSSIIEQRICNTQPCTGIWGCWSSWTHCNSHNLKQRNRTCLAFGSFVSGNQIPPLCSKAPSVEESSCDGWTPWSGWRGSCQDSNDVLTRTRKCLANECGDETYKQTKSCLDEDTLSVSSSHTETVSIIIVAIISGFLVGAIVGVCTVTCYQRYCRHRLGGGGNPHYLSAKSQNLYVSLPMLDLKSKHFSPDLSNFGTMRSTSTLSSKVCDTSIYNTTLGEYETATIKRSHNRNSTLFLNGMRADINSDSLFD